LALPLAHEARESRPAGDRPGLLLLGLRVIRERMPREAEDEDESGETELLHDFLLHERDRSGEEGVSNFPGEEGREIRNLLLELRLGGAGPGDLVADQRQELLPGDPDLLAVALATLEVGFEGGVVVRALDLEASEGPPRQMHDPLAVELLVAVWPHDRLDGGALG